MAGDRPVVSERQLLVIAGPTGVGKSSLAVEVALATGAEVVSADSRQLYQGLDIGTATPTHDDRKGVPHHMLDVVDPDIAVSAGWFAERVRPVIDGIWERGNAVVVVGGSTLYVHSLVEGLADLPPIDAPLREQLEREAASAEGRAALYAELSRADPSAAATLDPTKSQRLARLVGLTRTLGRAVSEVWADQDAAPYPSRLVVLTRPRADLYRRIDERVREMWSLGLKDEAERVLARWPDARSLLESTIGYKEVLSASGAPEADVIARVQRNSRRYAKRQLTWYRRYSDADWLDAGGMTARALLDAVSPWPRSPRERSHIQSAPPHPTPPATTDAPSTTYPR